MTGPTAEDAVTQGRFSPANCLRRAMFHAHHEDWPRISAINVVGPIVMTALRQTKEVFLAWAIILTAAVHVGGDVPTSGAAAAPILHISSRRRLFEETSWLGALFLFVRKTAFVREEISTFRCRSFFREDISRPCFLRIPIIRDSMEVTTRRAASNEFDAIRGLCVLRKITCSI